VFGVSSSKLLGYTVSAWGIDVDPKKVEAIEQLQPPRTQKEIQTLACMMAALKRFIFNWVNMVCHSTSYYEKWMDSSGMIKRQWLSLSLSNI
jgi:hypothetical protein